jgi:predicted helicase
MLLAYYVADINIEAAYHELSKAESYLPYDGICLTDTFQLNEHQNSDVFSQILKGNSDRVENQKKQPIMVCFGNPPYSVGQKSANDNAQNLHYPMLEQKIDCTYASATKAGLKKALYDSYVKAFRWASDRIQSNGNDQGIIAFISNGGWLDGNAMDGMRKCLEEEFSSIYVLNLRGNQRTEGELSRKEGGKIFGEGSRTPVTITFLVKKADKEKNSKATIYYHDIGDYHSREKKLQLVKEFGSIENIKWSLITPNDKYDWINQRGDEFDKLIPMSPEKKFTESSSFFNTIAIGMATNRDSWVCNYSKTNLSESTSKFIEFYNQQREEYIKLENKPKPEDFVSNEQRRISWTRGLRKLLTNNNELIFNQKYITKYSYRPFTRQNIFKYKPIIESFGIWDKICPISDNENLVICLKGIGDKNFSCLITNTIPDLQLIFNGQCFPLYYYEQIADKELNDRVDISSDYAHTGDMFGENVETNSKNNIYTDNFGNKYERKDAITNWMLKEIKSRYKTNNIRKEQIFYYVYGLLHSEDYRKKFDAELKKSLPRLPIVDSFDDFKSFEKAGRALAELHLNYEPILCTFLCNYGQINESSALQC